MAYLIEISTAVPPYRVSPQETESFFSQSIDPSGTIRRKVHFLTSRSGIQNRNSCIPDFKGGKCELYKNYSYLQPLEERMALYKQKVIPLAAKALERVLRQSGAAAGQITHLISVSCTGMMAPGLELMLAEKFELRGAEKIAFNFMGCYGGLKALKHAATIAEAEPGACVAVVCAELCSLHYYPSVSPEDIISYLLFSDGAAAALVCGRDHELLKERPALKITGKSSAIVPSTAELMTWNLSSTAFRMYLSTEVADALNKNLGRATEPLITGKREKIKYWAVHPGGVKIVEAVKNQLKLSEEDISHSMDVLKRFGNMSSGTILFVLNNVFSRIKKNKDFGSEIFSCAFGPGLTIEMMTLCAVNGSAASPVESPVNETTLLTERTA